MSSMVPAGAIESTYSSSEQIGLPNYSHINVMISAKAQAPDGYENQLYDYLFSVVHNSLNAAIADVSTRLNFPIVGREQVPTADFSFICSPVEISFSMSERVGLPEYSHVNVLGSSKRIVAAGQEMQGIDYLRQVVAYHLGIKRTFITENPRPWIQK